MSIHKMQELASKHGGRCLSTVYANSHTHLRWRCSEGHEWESVPHNIKHLGHWCPTCAVEERRLGLHEMQQLAMEHGGQCLSTEYVNNGSYLLWRCSEGHEWKARPSDIKYCDAWCPICSVEKTRLGLQQMQELARQHGGECLSDEYINAQTKLRWRCRQGHEWEATPNSVNGHHSWCRTCSSKAAGEARRGKKIGRGSNTKLTLEDMQDLATLYGGECLSEEYVNSRTHLRWQCRHGHRWDATPRNVKNYGQWCPTCAIEKRRLGLQEMQELARQRGGECLSTQYINIDAQLRWHCSQGHEWEAAPSDVKHKGTWCPICATKVRCLGLQEMQELAAAHGGECLSDQYINTHTQLRWRCVLKHEWEAVPYSIKQGSWCPVCATKRVIDQG